MDLVELCNRWLTNCNPRRQTGVRSRPELASWERLPRAFVARSIAVFNIRLTAALAASAVILCSVSYAEEADTALSSRQAARQAAQERILELYLRNLTFEVKDILLRVEASQQDYYVRNSSYAHDLRDLGFPSDPWVTDSGGYTVSIRPGSDENHYEAVALLNYDGEEFGRCRRFSIDSNGVRHSAPETDCWIDMPSNPVTSEPGALASSSAELPGQDDLGGKPIPDEPE